MLCGSLNTVVVSEGLEVMAGCVVPSSSTIKVSWYFIFLPTDIINYIVLIIPSLSRRTRARHVLLLSRPSRRTVCTRPLFIKLILGSLLSAFAKHLHPVSSIPKHLLKSGKDDQQNFDELPTAHQIRNLVAFGSHEARGEHDGAVVVAHLVDGLSSDDLLFYE